MGKGWSSGDNWSSSVGDLSGVSLTNGRWSIDEGSVPCHGWSGVLLGYGSVGSLLRDW